MKTAFPAALSFITAIAVAQAGNLLSNAGFESADLAEWVVFSSTTDTTKIAVSTKTSHAGKQSARLEAQAVANSYQGVFQSVSVAPGTQYRFTVFVRNDRDRPLQQTARGQISIEWKNSDEAEVGRVWGPDWGVSLENNKWTKFEMTAPAPSEALRAHFVITQHDGTETASGAFFVDDAQVEALP